MKRMKLYMDRKKLYIILCIILVCVFSLTLAYAALSVTLNINGNAEVIGSNWDIKFKNPVVKVGSVTSTAPRIVSLNEVEFSTTLNMPGDFYEFTIDIANDGTIDAMIENIRVVSNITENDLKYINALIEYDNGVQVTNKQLLKADSFVRLKCRIEYRKDITASDLPTTSTSLDFTMHFVYSDGPFKYIFMVYCELSVLNKVLFLIPICSCLISVVSLIDFSINWYKLLVSLYFLVIYCIVSLLCIIFIIFRIHYFSYIT